MQEGQTTQVVLKGQDVAYADAKLAQRGSRALTRLQSSRRPSKQSQLLAAKMRAAQSDTPETPVTSVEGSATPSAEELERASLQKALRSTQERTSSATSPASLPHLRAAVKKSQAPPALLSFSEEGASGATTPQAVRRWVPRKQ